jgi:endonuclease YncB( thermonuclease family)
MAGMRPGRWAALVLALGAAGGGAVMLTPRAPAAVPHRAQVIDGDTFTLDGRTVRLWGVDAPEGRQMCEDEGGHPWRCGQGAAQALAEHLAGATLHCEPVETDRYGREVARCRIGDEDLGGWLVRTGWAFDYRRHSGGHYAAEEAAARRTRVGLWRGTATEPWRWRQEQRAATTARQPSAPDPACRLKGNINAAGGRIVHSPGQRDYEATRIDPAADERWFCTIEEARRAGWRAAAR